MGSFSERLKVLMDKYEHTVVEVADRANTCDFVIRDWISGVATPAADIQRQVLDALDNPNESPRLRRGLIGIYA